MVTVSEAEDAVKKLLEYIEEVLREKDCLILRIASFLRGRRYFPGIMIQLPKFWTQHSTVKVMMESCF